MPVLFCWLVPKAPGGWLRRLLALCALLALALPSMVLAQVNDPFAVRNVPEDIHDQNLAQARSRALLLGQRDAYQILMQRLTAQSDWPRLPKLDDGALEDLVQDVGIDQEKNSSVRMLLTLSVRFKPDAIRLLLRTAGIAYAEWRGRPVTVIPLWQTESGPVFTETANPWRDLWRSGAAQGLVSTALPPPEALDFTKSAALATAGSDLLTDLSQRLNNPDVLVLLASAGKSENGSVKLEVTLLGQGPLAGSMSSQHSYVGDAGETLDQILLRAASDVAFSLDQSWKTGNLLRYDQQGSLSAIVPLGGFDDWVAVRDKLTRATAVRSYDVAALSKSEATMVLHYVGEQSQLGQALMQNGLVLTWEDDHWSLRNVAARGK